MVENSKYVRIAKALLTNQPTWKVVVIVRDPRGVALSSKLAGERKNVHRPVKDKINLLLSFAKEAYAIAQTSQTIIVRYEDLCHNSVEVLEAICDFIGVEFEITMLDFKKHKGQLLMGNRMIHDDNQEIREDTRWRYLLSEEEKALFMRKDLIEVYNNLGYNLTENN